MNAPYDVTDQLETLILLALDAKHDSVDGVVFNEKMKKRGRMKEYYTIGDVVSIDPMLPKSAYTADLAESGRIFTFNHNLLMGHPAEIIGREAELIYFDTQENKMIWTGYRQIAARPKMVSHFSKASHYYEVHRRIVKTDGSGKYMKEIIAYDNQGKPMTLFLDHKIMPMCRVFGETGVAMASMIEDAHRPNTMLASVKDATEIKFPVPLDNYKKVFADRDAPMIGNRRKAILHWVSKHLRKSASGGTTDVKQHTRGVEEFLIDGLTIRISPNTKMKEN